jgi:cytosine/adenosine deaminase-related metal-dependent hydrolase
MPSRLARALASLAFVLATYSAAIRAETSDAIFGDSFELPCPGAAPGVTAGIGSALLLRGTVVTPTDAFVGEVLVSGDTITCASVSCAGQAGADTATVIETRALIFPGLIDTDNHALFDAFDENDWAPAQLYESHNDWTTDSRYGALVDAKQYLNGESESPVDYGCELDKYAELKALLAGTTSLVTNPGTGRTCYGSLARTIDQNSNDLGADYIQTATLFPTTSAADQVCANFSADSTHAYLVHIAEGTNDSVRQEFAHLGTVTTTDSCLYAPQTAIVHGTALGDGELTTMASAGMSLVWTPRSDMALYGQTADVPLALAKGINVALGTNSSISGSHNVLALLRAADAVDNAAWGDVLSAYDLVQMVTTHAAHALALDDVLGSIAPGKKADLAVVSANTCSMPWSSLVHAHARDVALVLVGGVPLYGDVALQAAAPALPGCDALDVCGAAKFACVAEAGGNASNKFGQTLTEIVGNLSQGLADYDALGLTEWDFSPLTPLVDCP